MKKPIRIWLQKHVVQGRLPILDNWYREHIEAVADPGTEISIRSLPPSAYPSDTPHDYVACGSVAIHFNNYFANTALQAEREGYDAWVIAAGQDPGLPHARCLSTIPALGMGATAFHYCAQKEIRFAIVGFIPGLREPIIENLHRYRTDHLLACYSLLPGGKSSVLSAMKGTPDQLLEEATAAAGQAVAAGAQVIIPAEGLITEALWANGIRSLQGLPVLDTLGLLIKTAEAEVRLKAMGCIARPSTGFWYARPDPEVMNHLETTFARDQSSPDQVTS
jgi:allantoin racemase